MRPLRVSQVWALMGVQIIAVPLLAFGWGVFDHRTAVGFLVANAIWTMFILGGLFDNVERKEVEIQNDHT